MFVDPTNRWFILYVLCSFTLAFAAFVHEARKNRDVLNGGLIRYLFPKGIYFHRSAITDYWFFCINRISFALALAGLIGVTAIFERLAYDLLKSLAVPPTFATPDWLAMMITTAAWAVFADFGLWLGHYLLHKVPVLWEFHKVHHSAEVLTPFTAGRVHPVDDALTMSCAGLCGGVALAVCQFAFGSKALMFSIFNINIVLALFYIFGFHLRHSHVWLPYRGLLGRILISPAHHQLHHSVAQRHWDKNLGFMFAIWDWMFGTLYPVDVREDFAIGMNGVEESEYHSVAAMYLLPFAKAWRRMNRVARLRRPRGLPDGGVQN
jgi:sterol desaturase/sphingolipid hydroxylase (fatty acid hydroxylase superfamily)